MTHDFETPRRPRVGRPRLHPAPAQQPPTPPLTPDAATACHAHLIAQAVAAVTAAEATRAEVEATALADGFPLKAWHRALELLTTDPEHIAQVERHASLVLMAVKAGLAVEERMIEATTDQAPEDRDRRIRAEGYHAAVMGRAADVDLYERADDRAVWTAGWWDFRQDLTAFEAERAAMRMSAFSPQAPSDTLNAPTVGATP